MLFIDQIILKERAVVYTKILSSSIFNIYNNNFFFPSNQHIRMIFEALCDTKDWSNNAEN